MPRPSTPPSTPSSARTERSTLSDDSTPPIFIVLDTGTTVDVDGNSWPTAVIDAADHPEVADLARVHAVEGIGDIQTEALRLPMQAEDGTDIITVLLGVRITRPVLCAFALAFSLPAQRHVLDEAADAGHLMLASTPPDRVASDQPLWLAIDLDATSLRAALG